MAATINFFAGEGFAIQNLSGSGLGFYGQGSFGASVRVGQYQDNTYITDSTGTVQAQKTNNTKYINANSGQLGTGDTHNLLDIPNYLATLNISFSNSTPCQVQGATVTFFDRSSTNNPPSGVLPMIAEVVHPVNTMGAVPPLGSGSTQWSTPGGSGGVVNGYTWQAPMALRDSPGLSGLGPVGGNTVSSQHDWYVLVSQSPLAIGSQLNNALFVQLEYL
jgi:hypothetical protein